MSARHQLYVPWGLVIAAAILVIVSVGISFAEGWTKRDCLSLGTILGTCVLMGKMLSRTRAKR